LPPSVPSFGEAGVSYLPGIESIRLISLENVILENVILENVIARRPQASEAVQQERKQHLTDGLLGTASPEGYTSEPCRRALSAVGGLR
jgi:hypothetical protein